MSKTDDDQPLLPGEELWGPSRRSYVDSGCCESSWAYTVYFRFVFVVVFVWTFVVQIVRLARHHAEPVPVANGSLLLFTSLGFVFHAVVRESFSFLLFAWTNMMFGFVVLGFSLASLGDVARFEHAFAVGVPAMGRNVTSFGTTNPSAALALFSAKYGLRVTEFILFGVLFLWTTLVVVRFYASDRPQVVMYKPNADPETSPIDFVARCCIQKKRLVNCYIAINNTATVLAWAFYSLVLADAVVTFVEVSREPSGNQSYNVSDGGLDLLAAAVGMSVMHLTPYVYKNRPITGALFGRASVYYASAVAFVLGSVVATFSLARDAQTLQGYWLDVDKYQALTSYRLGADTTFVWTKPRTVAERRVLAEYTAAHHFIGLFLFIFGVAVAFVRVAEVVMGSINRDGYDVAADRNSCALGVIKCVRGVQEA